MGFTLFRHTHASMMLNAGTNWKELQHRCDISLLLPQLWIHMLNPRPKKIEEVDIFLEKITRTHRLIHQLPYHYLISKTCSSLI